MGGKEDLTVGLKLGFDDGITVGEEVGFLVSSTPSGDQEGPNVGTIVGEADGFDDGASKIETLDNLYKSGLNSLARIIISSSLFIILVVAYS